LQDFAIARGRLNPARPDGVGAAVRAGRNPGASSDATYAAAPRRATQKLEGLSILEQRRSARPPSGNKDRLPDARSTRAERIKPAGNTVSLDQIRCITLVFILDLILNSLQNR
jgi:hypothetical protein